MPAKRKVASIMKSLRETFVKDQADKLAEAGVDAAALNSTLGAAEEAEALEDLALERAEIVFSPPDRLATAEFQATFAGKAIDVPRTRS